jgi:hypothetical protein
VIALVLTAAVLVIFAVLAGVVLVVGGALALLSRARTRSDGATASAPAPLRAS